MRRESRRQMLRLAGRLLARPTSRERHQVRRNILVIRPDHLGDLLFLTPALRRLRRAFPQARIVALVGPWGEPALATNPHLDGALICPFPAFGRGSKPWPWQPYRLLLEQAARLRGYQFDLALNFRFDFWWGALLARLAGIPERLGWDIPECRPFLNRALPFPSGRHQVELNLSLVEEGLNLAVDGEATSLEFHPAPGDEKAAEELTGARRDAASGPWIAIHPGAGAPVKLWRSDGFARVADSLATDFGARVVLTGSAQERGLVEEVAAQMRARPLRLVGARLGELAALLRQCHLALGVDSGVLHLAVAVGTPTVHLFGPVAPEAFGPWGEEGRHLVVRAPLPCFPCERLDYPLEELGEHPCVREIEEEQVLEAARSLLSR